MFFGYRTGATEVLSYRLSGPLTFHGRRIHDLDQDLLGPVYLLVRVSLVLREAVQAIFRCEEVSIDFHQHVLRRAVYLCSDDRLPGFGAYLLLCTHLGGVLFTEEPFVAFFDVRTSRFSCIFLVLIKRWFSEEPLVVFFE